jgi:hypothetical protein
VPPQGRILVLRLLLDHQIRIGTWPLGEMVCDLVFFSSKIEEYKKESGETIKEYSSPVDVGSALALADENDEAYKDEDFD